MRTTAHKIDAGQLRDQVEVLELTSAERRYTWSPVASCRAEATLSDKSNYFARSGVGARDVSFVLRHRPALSLDNALRWRGPQGWEH
nr:hypothetical protein [Oscillospiraceae bacterium]